MNPNDYPPNLFADHTPSPREPRLFASSPRRGKTPRPAKTYTPSAPRTQDPRPQPPATFQDRLTTLSAAVNTAATIDGQQHAHIAAGIGETLTALARTFNEGRLSSASNIAEAVAGFHQALEGMQELARRYAQAAPNSLHLYRRPVDRGRDYIADDTEAGSMADGVALSLGRLADALTPAIEEAEEAARRGMMFYAPDAPTSEPQDGTETFLYFWYDADGRLLYVGITDDLPGRQTSHAKRSSWAQFADHAKVERFPSREAAVWAEKTAIRERKPLFNHAHNSSPEARERLVRYLMDRGRADLLAPAVSRG